MRDLFETRPPGATATIKDTGYAFEVANTGGSPLESVRPSVCEANFPIGRINLAQVRSMARRAVSLVMDDELGS